MKKNRIMPALTVLLAFLAALIPSPAMADTPPPEPTYQTELPTCLKPLDDNAVDTAAKWLVDYTDGDWTKTASASEKADVVLALVKTSAGATRATELTTQLIAEAAQVTEPTSVAKIMIALSASGVSEATTVIAELSKTIFSHVNDTGLFEVDYASAYTQALAVLALARADISVPSPMIETLFGFQTDDGHFGFSDGTNIVADADSTALALMAIRLLQVEPAVDTIATLELLEASATTEGYWENFSPINTTGLTISALNDWGATLPENSVSWLTAQQLPSGAWPAAVSGTEDDFLATTQAMFGVTGASFATTGTPFCATAVLPPIADTGSPWPMAALVGWSLLVLVLGSWGIYRVAKR